MHEDGRLAGVPLMVPVASYRTFSRFVLVASLGLLTFGAVAVAQDQPKDSTKDPKDEVQASRIRKLRAPRPRTSLPMPSTH